MKIFVLILMTFILCGCSENTSIISNPMIDAEIPVRFIVEIKGEVNNPGLYEMNNGDLIYDLIKMAGGFTIYADTTMLNLAQPLGNNQLIIIEKKDNQNNKKLININQATIEELMTLPQIGRVIAERIIAYRTKKTFTTIDEIREVSGIGEAVYLQIQALITV